MNDFLPSIRHVVENVWDHQYVVCGQDCDSLACYILLKLKYPHCQLIGLYDCEYVVQLIPDNEESFQKKLYSALWVDQDVLNGILCVGNHLCTTLCTVPVKLRNPQSFNPNDFFGVKRQQDKFPYSTAFMLFAAFENLWERSAEIDTLLMHADSAGENMCNYSINCNDWKNRVFPVGSKIHTLIEEMQKVYVKNWSHTCDSYCPTKKQTVSACICNHCSDLCLVRKEQRKQLRHHLEFMVSLSNIMPHCFDPTSRKDADINGTDQQKTPKIDSIGTLLSENKRTNTCKDKKAQEYIELLGGFQGLKFAVRDKGKFQPPFDYEDYLSEFNQFYAYLYRIIARVETSHQFTFFKKHYVAPAKAVNFDGAKLFRNDAGDYVNFDQLIDDLQLFSYVFLNAKMVRHTRNGGIMNQAYPFFESHMKTLRESSSYAKTMVKQ